MWEAWGTYIFLGGWLKWKLPENHLNAGINIADDICFSLIADLEIKRNLKYFVISENLVLLPPLIFWLVFSFAWKEDRCLIWSQSFERHWVEVVKKSYKKVQMNVKSFQLVLGFCFTRKRWQEMLQDADSSVPPPTEPVNRWKSSCCAYMFSFPMIRVS